MQGVDLFLFNEDATQIQEVQGEPGGRGVCVGVWVCVCVWVVGWGGGVGGGGARRLALLMSAPQVGVCATRHRPLCSVPASCHAFVLSCHGAPSSLPSHPLSGLQSARARVLRATGSVERCTSCA